MDRKEETGTDMLNGIVALLLALAALAERSAGRSLPVRWLVLWRLWQADAVARDFVAGSASNAAGWSPVLATVRYGTDPADAMDLAASFRALALIVRNMAAQIRRLSFLRLGRASGGRSQDGSSTNGLDAVIRTLGTAAFSPVQLSDTS